jgi:hypothetical protein
MALVGPARQRCGVVLSARGTRSARLVVGSQRRGACGTYQVGQVGGGEVVKGRGTRLSAWWADSSARGAVVRFASGIRLGQLLLTRRVHMSDSN